MMNSSLLALINLLSGQKVFDIEGKKAIWKITLEIFFGYPALKCHMKAIQDRNGDLKSINITFDLHSIGVLC